MTGTMENWRKTIINTEPVRLILTEDLHIKKARYWKISAANKKQEISKIISETWRSVTHYQIRIVTLLQHYKYYSYSSYNGKYIITDYSIKNYHSLEEPIT
jgi:hypothetical protein